MPDKAIGLLSSILMAKDFPSAPDDSDQAWQLDSASSWEWGDTTPYLEVPSTLLL